MTWEQFRHLHRDPTVVSLWLRWFGPLLHWLQPGTRRWLLGLGALVVAVREPVAMLRRSGGASGLAFDHATMLLVAALMSGYAVCCYLVARRFDSLPPYVRRHPLMFLHATFWVVLVVLWTTRSHSAGLQLLTGCAIVMPFLLWRLSYLALTAQRGKLTGTGPRDHALYIWPLWGGSDTPYGKGIDYLKSTEAGDAEALARSQLAGLKLLVLAFIFRAAVKLINGVVYGADNAFRHALGGVTLGLPTVDELLVAQPGAYSVWSSWLSIYCDLVLRVVRLAAYGHVIVGCLRLSGFNVFRNTYRPLLAETIIEFWNRYYYYFKELLVHFFFFPAFVRYFRHSPRMRLFCAVFASAFLGNLYYHAIQDESLVRGDWQRLAQVLVPRVNYCLLLALGIFVSMRREQRHSGTRSARRWPRRVLAIFGVWTFFAFIQLFHHGDPTVSARVEFILALFGIGRA